MLLKEFHESRKVLRVSIDITHEEGRSWSSELVVLKDGGNDVVGAFCFGCVAVAAAVPIDVVPVAEAPSFALTIGHKLGSAQLLKGGEPR